MDSEDVALNNEDNENQLNGKKRKLQDGLQKKSSKLKPSDSKEVGNEEEKKHELISEFNTETLKIYYEKLFPFKEMFMWLSYGIDSNDTNPEIEKHFFKNREFSFTLEGDIYVRYKSFKDEDEFRRAVENHSPHKIDIGSVYNYPPSMRTSVSAFVPMCKELVFDIDMTDYDNIRNCCDKANICNLCWPLMNAAIKVLDSALRDDFGFKHLLWVYSGRRGVHCWICDERALNLKNEAREAISEYLHVNLGPDGKNPDIMFPPMPALERAFNILEPYFIKIQIENMGLLDSFESWNEVLKYIPDEDIRKNVDNEWKNNSYTGIQKWEQLKKTLASHSKMPKGRKLNSCTYNIVFGHVYPRLDINVTKQMHHLLKSPFVIHPKTGRVCVPIDPQNCDDFDPQNVPTLSTLYEELYGSTANTSDKTGKAYTRTSLKKYINMFRSKFVLPVVKAANVNRRDSASLEF